MTTLNQPDMHVRGIESRCTAIEAAWNIRNSETP